MDIHGKNIIGFELSALGSKSFRGYDPRRGAPIEPDFHEATAAEVERALDLAKDAEAAMRNLQASEVEGFLLAIRGEILALGDRLVEKADEESALGIERLKGERDRTVNQIKMFADIVRDGSWVDARIDTAQPDRKPLPKPDIRRMLQSIGPVAVFGASNFPLAFSVAGGDTISAFAARNPVVVKAHPAHPATSELVAGAIMRAVQKTSIPQGAFSMLHGLSPEPSIALVTNPKTKAVAFTGSQRAGRALFDAAAKRPEPIPVFSEMGSVNPVFVLPKILEAKTESIAEGVSRSVLLGVGQFCTCPGLVLGLESEALKTFVDRLGEHFEQSSPGTMLNPGIAKGYAENLESASRVEGIEARRATRPADPKRTEGAAAVLITEGHTWLKNKALHEEIFGPTTVVVRCGNAEELLECARRLEGSLTATIHGTPEELGAQAALIDILRERAGRLIFNGFPTGVEVGYAMQHGGPYPATTDARFTSVGAAAIYRFARPVCFQNFPDSTLPPEMQNANPLGIWRMVNGQFTKNGL